MSERKRLWIEEFNTPWITFGGLEIDTASRTGAPRLAAVLKMKL